MPKSFRIKNNLTKATPKSEQRINQRGSMPGLFVYSSRCPAPIDISNLQSIEFEDD